MTARTELEHIFTQVRASALKDCSANVFTDTVNSTATTRSSADADLRHLPASDVLVWSEEALSGTASVYRALSAYRHLTEV